MHGSLRVPRVPRLLLVALAAVALSGCLGPASGQDPTLHVTLEQDADVLAPGEWVNLTYVVENRGPGPFTYQHPGCPAGDAEGDVVLGDRRIEVYRYHDDRPPTTCAVYERTLDPGDRIEETLNWNGRTQRDGTAPHAGDRVEPGTYDVVVVLRHADGGPDLARTARVEVQG